MIITENFRIELGLKSHFDKQHGLLPSNFKYFDNNSLKKKVDKINQIITFFECLGL